ncbi:MAG: RagB/SusD family nutrient uptake outer membrane protein [Porphyromonadaceae bacterium]|nr:RagB/SusD family nutrient uptake outer membrane protein [Porphyromonadaceae bacterium]
MKKNILIAITLAANSFAFSSCNDFLSQENPNKVAAESYFQTENDVERALNGVYLALRSDACLGEGSTLYTEERSDNAGRLDNQSSSGEPFQFTDFSLLPSNTYLKTHWTAMYTAITRANFLLTYIDEVTFDDESTKETYKAEAKFVRALVYFHLVRKWGDVPLVTTYLTNQSEINEHTFREKRETVYAQIIQDLKDGLGSNLVNIQPVSGKGKGCKVAINGLLGQVYLTMATTLSDGNKQSNLENAKKYLTDAYNMRTFGSLKEIPYEDVFDVEKKSSCPEIIFQIVYKQGDKDYYSSIASDNQAKGETINSQVKSTGSGNFVNPDLVKEYEDTDLRKTWSVKYASNAIAKSYIITKYRDTSDAAGTLGYGGNDFILMRYADLILMLAEVNMYLNDESSAIKYLNEVRERAGMPTYEVAITDASYKAKYPTLKLAILHERRVELAFENQRWFDLLRFFTPEELKTYIQSKKQDDYGISNLNNFGTKDYYYPIPFDEYKLDPEKMWQNPGY